jgi:hypothetical protein
MSLIKELEVLAFARMTIHFFGIGEILTFVRILERQKTPLIIPFRFRRRPESPYSTTQFVIPAKAGTS